jgi:hypothetical protein
MKRCGVCGREYAAEARFCGEDGTPLPEIDKLTSADNMAAYDELARNLRDNPQSREAMDALWGAICRLPSWLFLLRGDNMIPITCIIDGKHMVMAFTDHPAMQRFSKHQQYDSSDDYSSMILSVEKACEMLLGLRSRGAEMLVFNHGGDAGFFIPINTLPSLYQHFNDGRELPCVQDAEFKADIERS